MMKEDQLTLRDFIAWCRQAILFFVGLFRSILGLANTYRVWVGGFILVGGLVGYLSGKDAVSNFQAGITCTYNELHKKSYGEMILELSKSIQAGQTKLLASTLNLGEDTAASITGIKAVNVAGAPLHEDLNPEKLPFYISYTLKDPAYAHRINQSIIAYLLQCDYNAVRRKIRINAASEKSKFLQSQIAQIDSLKSGYINYFGRGRSASTEPADIKAEELYKEAEALFNSKQDQDWTIQYDNAVEIIYEQLPVMTSTPSNRIKLALLGALAGVVCALLLGVYKEAGKSA